VATAAANENIACAFANHINLFAPLVAESSAAEVSPADDKESALFCHQTKRVR
jgi:hypothetical protein